MVSSGDCSRRDGRDWFSTASTAIPGGDGKLQEVVTLWVCLAVSGRRKMDIFASGRQAGLAMI
jgi:hypothetical protein